MHHQKLVRAALASLTAVSAIALLPAESSAVITYNNALGNTTAPAGDQGWSYTGAFSLGSAVAIAPNAFLATVHQGGTVGDQFELNGTNYTTTAVNVIAGTDLAVWHVSGTLNAYTQLYTGNPVGQSFNNVGYGQHTLGTQVDAIAGAPFNGWQWAGAFGKSWGTNTVDTTVTLSGNGYHELQFDFDPTANEGTIADHDSGGGVFILDGGVWKVAGINYAVEATFSLNSNGSSPFNAAIFDKTNLYVPTGPGTAESAGAGPALAYAHDVSYYAPQIQALVPEPGSTCFLLATGLLALARRNRSR